MRVFLSLTLIQLVISLTEGNQLQNLIKFARGEGRPPGGAAGQSGSAAGRSGSAAGRPGSGAGSAAPEGAAGRSGSVLSLAAPATSSFPQQQAFIPPPIPFAGIVT